MKTFREESREVPLVREFDVIVCGGGPAGVAAALAAARTGGSVALLEAQGCLGGVWTSGTLAWIIDVQDKPGILEEITNELDRRGARAPRGGTDYAYDIEEMKLLLEEMCVTAGIYLQFHTRVAAAGRSSSNRLAVVLTESKSGRQAWAARCFVDATGDGDLAAQAGCGFDLGKPETGECQPLTLTAVVTGIHASDVERFIGGGSKNAKELLLAEIQRAGVAPSYALPVLFRIHDELFALAANHEYGVSALDAGEITRATVRARAEVHNIVSALRTLGGVWQNLRVVATGNQIGIREGRRIHGLYTVKEADLAVGARHEDAVCRVHFGIDVHSPNPNKSKTFDHAGKPRTLPYDIPLRALIARDVDGLLLAGRCISGDFIAHSSYRVTGNAVAIGQAAGVVAALSAAENCLPQNLPWHRVAEMLNNLTCATLPV